MTELTLEDIARQVGVSRSTVSRVINGSPHVSEDVRERVLKAVQTTGFQPNAAARSLASQRSYMIGLVLPQSVSAFFTDPFFPHLTQGIAYGCNNNDLTLSLFLAGNHEDEEIILPRISRRGQLDGVLVQSGQLGDWLIERLAKSSLPTVMIGRPFDPAGINYIDVDNVRGASSAVRHLARLGYRRIAHITGSAGSSATVDRLEGYKAALQEAGQPVDLRLIAEGNFSESSGYMAMKQLLPHNPQAVFAASDTMAVGAMRAIHEAGLRVPEDVAVVGYDDLPVAATITPALTTVRQPILKFGARAVELLMDVIANGSAPARHIILDTELILRDSCGRK